MSFLIAELKEAAWMGTANKDECSVTDELQGILWQVDYWKGTEVGMLACEINLFLTFDSFVHVP